MWKLLSLPALLLVAAAPAGAVTYADLAALTLAAPVIVRATVTRTETLTGSEAPGLAAGDVRLLVRATLAVALRAPGDVPATIEYLLDTRPDDRGRPPRLKGQPVLVFARPGARAGQVALVARAAQLPATPAAEATVRAVLAEDRAGMIPVVTGVADAFHVAGAVPGEAESQIFLTTAAGRPVSLVVLTRPGAAKSLRIALGEVVDDSAVEVRRDTLLWYRLACTLPRALPATTGDERAALEADYAFALSSLGPCERTL